MELWLVVIISTLIAVASSAFGALVQKKTLFLFPYDPVTVMITAACIICAVFEYPVSYFWYVPALCGYFLGYYINGLTVYTSVIQVDVAGQAFDEHPIVTYECDIGGRKAWIREGSSARQLCMAEQSWKALFKRWFLGMHHVIDTKGAKWEPAWIMRMKIPAFPLFTRKAIVVETWNIFEKDIGYGRKWNRKDSKYVPRWNMKQSYSMVQIAHSDMIPRVRLIKNQSALDELNILLDEAQRKIIDLENERKAISTLKMAELIAGIMDVSPLGCVEKGIEEKLIRKGMRAESEVIGEAEQ